MKDMLGAFMAGIVIGIALVMGLLEISGNAPKSWMNDAVKRGFAEYTVDAAGKVAWHWKESPNVE